MKRLIACVAFLAVVKSAASPALAVGVGVYADGGIGSGDITVKPEGSRSHSSSLFSAGLLLDTSLARDLGQASLPREWLGYRLKLGYQRQDWDDGVLANAGVVDGLLEFKLITTHNVRFWIGPVVRAQYLWGTEGVTTPYYGFAGEHLMRSKFTAWGGGLGAVLGANLSSLGVGLEAGYIYNWLFGETNGPQGANRNFDATEGHFYGSIAVMLR